MAKVLYIKASPRTGRSHSVAVADEFVAAYRKNNPKDEVMTVDLFQKDLPPCDGVVVQAKYSILHGQKHTKEELEAWKWVETVIEEFKSADKYVFAIPMWNFGIPYRLKQYIDILLQPTYTFSFSPEKGYKGLLTGKRAFVAYASGGEYGAGSGGESYDFQRKYFEMILGFIGITDVERSIVEPTLAGGPEVAKTKRAEAIETARKLAVGF